MWEISDWSFGITGFYLVSKEKKSIHFLWIQKKNLYKEMFLETHRPLWKRSCAWLFFAPLCTTILAFFSSVFCLLNISLPTLFPYLFYLTTWTSEMNWLYYDVFLNFVLWKQNKFFDTIVSKLPSKCQKICIQGKLKYFEILFQVVTSFWLLSAF